MLPVWQEVPHHSVGPGLVLNCAKRQRAQPTVNLYHVSSPFLWTSALTHVHNQAETNIWARDFFFWSCMFACTHTHTHANTLSGLITYPPPFVSKVQYVVALHTCWSKSLCMTRYFSHTFTLSPSIPLSPSLFLLLTHSLFHRVVIGMCVCAGADCETDEWPAMADS